MHICIQALVDMNENQSVTIINGHSTNLRVLDSKYQIKFSKIPSHNTWES